MKVPVLVLGATSLVGQYLLDMLSTQRVRVLAVSRGRPDKFRPEEAWLQQDLSVKTIATDANVVISLGPLRFAEECLAKNRRVGRLIALSSASTQFKANSPDPDERKLIAGLLATEHRIARLCRAMSVEATILKPTMIYGAGLDGNVATLASLMRRFKIVPYCGKGLRQPVHAQDLAELICRCLMLGKRSSGNWLLGGGETLDYPNMLRRIAAADRIDPWLFRLPVQVMISMLYVSRLFGQFKLITGAMVRRQRHDLNVDDRSARQVLGWNPRPFRPEGCVPH